MQLCTHNPICGAYTGSDLIRCEPLRVDDGSRDIHRSAQLLAQPLVLVHNLAIVTESHDQLLRRDREVPSRKQLDYTPFKTENCESVITTDRND